jgi:hypothetical protein
MSTTYGTGLVPNLRPPAPRIRLEGSRQAAYVGKQQGKTVNDKRITQLGIEGNDC